jgi:hypothetical protein
MRLPHCLKHSLGFAALALTASLLLGCAHALETHYFKSIDTSTGKPTNYYKVTIRARSAFASSRYISGYFDDATVDRYFGETSQPSKAAFRQDTGENPVVSLDKRLEDRKLVILFSSNSDDIVGQIQTIADGRELSALIAGFTNKDLLISAERAKADAREQAAVVTLLATAGDQLANALNPDDAQATHTALLEHVNKLASSLGNENPFSTLDDATQWLRFNRARLLKE